VSGGVLGRGGALLALGTVSCLVEETTCQCDGNFIIVTCFLVAEGSIFTPWERRTPDFGDVVARASDTPVPLRRQKLQAQLSILAKDIPQGSISTKMVFNKIGEGGGS